MRRVRVCRHAPAHSMCLICDAHTKCTPHDDERKDSNDNSKLDAFAEKPDSN